MTFLTEPSVAFVTGVYVGFIVGVALMCLMHANGRDDA